MRTNRQNQPEHREVIEKIVVHECSYDENGTRRQDIEIYYSFVGKIDLPEA
jgi:site-specific DNA recombinase